MKDEKKVKQGKKNRAAGSAWELRVRKDLESKWWTVLKNPNTVEFGGSTIIKDDKTGFLGADFSKDYGRIVPAKNKFLGVGKPMMLGGGWPDFVCIKRINPIIDLGKETNIIGGYDVIGVECKINGKLSKEEKEKARWLLENKIFSRILIASKEKIKNRVHVKYTEFKI